MTIDDFAKTVGVSMRTVYRRAEKAGTPIKDMRDAEGRITPEGIAALASLFDDVKCDGTTQQEDDTVETAENGAGHDAVAVEVAALRATVEGLERENAMLREMLADAKQNAEQWREQAQRMQDLHELEYKRLLPERAGMWQRMRSLFGGKKG